jgi:hypothetical protein
VNSLDLVYEHLSELVVVRAVCDHDGTREYAQTLLEAVDATTYPTVATEAHALYESLCGDGWVDWDLVDAQIGTLALAISTARTKS